MRGFVLSCREVSGWLAPLARPGGERSAGEQAAPVDGGHVAAVVDGVAASAAHGHGAAGRLGDGRVGAGRRACGPWRPRRARGVLVVVVFAPLTAKGRRRHNSHSLRPAYSMAPGGAGREGQSTVFTHAGGQQERGDQDDHGGGALHLREEISLIFQRP